MLRIKILSLAFAVGLLPTLACPNDAEAGPLLDWIRNRCRRTTCAQPCAQVAQNPYGLLPGQCLRTCQQTCSRTVVNYVPYTAYRTEWKRVPVTQYRPVTNSDPCTGCSVTCMRPCTTYTYQCQRVPYTTYRPEYRTESYQVPVTTLVNDCSTGTCATGTCATGTCATGSFGTECPTCIAPSNVAPTNTAPADGTYYEYPATNPPRGAVINPSGTFNTNVVPADQTPTLAPQSSRSVIDALRTEPTPTIYTQPTSYSQPQQFGGQTAQTPARKAWNYTPTRLASHAQIAGSQTQSRSGMQPINARRSLPGDATIRTTNQRDDLNGWKLVK